MTKRGHPDTRQAGGAFAWLLLWLAGISAIFAVCLLHHWPAVKSKLRTDVEVTLNQIGITQPIVILDGRDLVLRGAAENADMRAAASAMAQSIYGIRRVTNQLTLKPMAKSASPSLTLLSTDDGISLSGRMPSNNSADLLEAGIYQSFPDNALTNNIVVDIATQEPLWLEAALQSLQSLKRVTLPALQIKGDVIEIGGIVDSENTLNLIVDNLTQKFPHPFALSNKLEVQAPVAMIDPSLKLTRQNEKLIISGVVRTPQQVAAIHEVTSQAFSVNLIDNELSVDPAAKDAIWFDAALKMLPTMDKLHAMDLVITGNTMTIDGEASSESQRDFHLSTINQTVGKLLSVSENIKLVSPTDASTTDTVIEPKETSPNIAPVEAVVSTPSTQVDEAEPVNVAQPLPIEAPATIGALAVANTTETAIASEETSTTENTAVIVESEPTKPTPRVQRTMDELLASIDVSSIEFSPGSSALLADSYHILDDVAAILLDYPARSVNIIGHTDSEGSEESNLALSQSRAESVRQYFLSKGIAAIRLRSYGYGENLPIADNQTPEGRAQNRRIEFSY